MKSKLLLLLLILNLHVYASKEYDVRVNGNSYIIVDTLCVSPDVAYNNAQDWILKSSVSYKGAIQYENRDQKKLIAKSGVAFPYKAASNVESYLIFDLSIEMKEGKYRIKIENIKGFDILHSVDFGFGPTGEDTSETDIVAYSGYTKDEVSGEFKYFYEEKYENNKLLLQELNNKKVVIKKKKELTQIDKEIKMIENQQELYDKKRNLYLIINSTINNYIELLSKQINYNDDF